MALDHSPKTELQFNNAYLTWLDTNNADNIEMLGV